MTIPQPFLSADADAFIQNALTMWRDGTGAAFAIADAATDRLLGAVTRFGPDGHQATFGLWLAPNARGRGVGSRSLRLVADWTFATTAAIRLDTFIMVGNEASNRMVERAGFRREGVLRAWDLHHDGVPVDCVVHSRIAATDRSHPCASRQGGPASSDERDELLEYLAWFRARKRLRRSGNGELRGTH